MEASYGRPMCVNLKTAKILKNKCVIRKKLFVRVTQVGASELLFFGKRRIRLSLSEMYL
jgi:hypothetical protein